MACESSCHVHKVITTSASSHAGAMRRIRLHGHSLSVQALTPCCWKVSVWLACCTARRPFGGTSSRFGSVTSYTCARRTVCTTTSPQRPPHRSGTSQVHGLSRVPLQAQQSITNSALRLLVTMSGCVPGVSGLWRCSIYSWFGETGWGEQQRANYAWVAQETILTPLELHPKLREGAETEVPR